MEKVPLQHRLDQEAARDPHEQERKRRLEEEISAYKFDLSNVTQKLNAEIREKQVKLE